MLSRLIELSIENRMLVIAITLLVAIGGVYSAVTLPIDAVPDMTNIQVQVLSDAGALSPVEVEKYVSFPIETTMSGLPRVEQIRSVSKFGLSVVTIVFEEGTDIQWARQLVAQRLPSAIAKIPPGAATPELGPMATALGEILQFEVRGDGWSPMDLRTLLEWDIAPRLREVRGVTEINAHGGFYKSYEVRPDPDRLASERLSFEDLFRAIQGNNQTAGGGYVVHNGEQRLIRGLALLKDIGDLESIVVRREANGTPLLVRDVASVTVAPLTRQGAATRDGRGEAVIGLVMMTYGENSREVVKRAKARLDEIRGTLPAGVSVEILYDRASLIGRTLATVLTNLCEGGLFVIAVLLLTLGSFRAGLLVTLAIPLSMLFATNLMSATAVTASLMSLGAIDFGLIVDSSVIMIENCVRRLSHPPDGRTRLEIIRDAAVEVRKPTMFGELIIGVVYLPVLALNGTEGKLFKPMALTVLFALAGSLILSLTFMPAVATLMLPKTIKEGNVWLIEQVRRVYQPVLKLALARPLFTAGVALAIFAVSVPVAFASGWPVHAETGRRGPVDRSLSAADRNLGGLVRYDRRDRKGADDLSRGAHRLLQDGPAGDRQRHDGRERNRHLDHAQAPRRVAWRPIDRRTLQGNGPTARGNVRRRSLRRDAADRDASQRTRGRRQGRRRRLYLWRRPQRAQSKRKGDRGHFAEDSRFGGREVQLPGEPFDVAHQAKSRSPRPLRHRRRAGHGCRFRARRPGRGADLRCPWACSIPHPGPHSRGVAHDAVAAGTAPGCAIGRKAGAPQATGRHQLRGDPGHCRT